MTREELRKQVAGGSSPEALRAEGAAAERARLRSEAVSLVFDVLDQIINLPMTDDEQQRWAERIVDAIFGGTP